MTKIVRFIASPFSVLFDKEPRTLTIHTPLIKGVEVHPLN